MVPSFVHYLEVLEGSDGDKMPGKSCGNCFGIANYLIVLHAKGRIVKNITLVWKALESISCALCFFKATY